MKVYNQNIEPLKLLLEKYNFKVNEIGDIITGQKYTAVLLNNGNIGVCANLSHKIDTKKKNYSKLNLQNIFHRIVLNAYFNALLNYSNIYKTNADIFDSIDFRNYKKVVMLGLFEPIIKKFDDVGISITIFDPGKNDNVLTPILEQKKLLGEADAVILTSTSIFNATFIDSISATKDNCDIYMLGPSSIMTQEILDYRNIKVIFGAAFKKSDHRVLNIIKNDGGTKDFLKYGNKRYLQKVEK